MADFVWILAVVGFLALGSLSILVFPRPVAAASAAQVTLAVDGQAPVEVGAAVAAGTVYLPVDGVVRALGVQSVPLSDGIVRWTLGGRMVTLDWNAGVIHYEGRQERIVPAPRRAGEDVQLPVSFIADLFDLEIQWEPSLGTLALIPREGQPRLPLEAGPSRGVGPPGDGGPPGDVGLGSELGQDGDRTWTRSLAFEVLGLSPVESIRMRSVHGRLALEIAVQGESEAEAALLTDPARLVVDLEGAILESDFVRHVGGRVVRRLRAARTSLDTTRVVLDLSAPTGYTLKPRPDGDGWLLILQHQLSRVVVRREGGRMKLYVNTSSAPDYRTMMLRDPLRLVFDFQTSTLVGGAREIPVDDPVVRAVRVSQFMPDVVRVVLDLKSEVRLVEVPFIPTGPDGDAGADNPLSWDAAMAFELLAPLDHLALRSSELKAELTLESEGIVKPELFYRRDPTRLIIDIPGVFLNPDGGETVEDVEERLRAEAGGIVRRVEVDPGAGGTGQRVRLSVATDGLQPYEVSTSKDGRRAVVSIGKPNQPEYVVVIDPGHGGHDPGAIGPDGAMEKVYNLDIALRLEELLKEVGIGVALTRRDDRLIPLEERPAIAERHGADLFISIHINAAVNEAPSGTATLYSPILPANRPLARIVQRELVRALGTVNRGIRIRRELAVLRRATMPAVLVEVAFIQNPFDGKQLKKPEFRQAAAGGIFNGILAFLGVEAQREGEAQ